MALYLVLLVMEIAVRAGKKSTPSQDLPLTREARPRKKTSTVYDLKKAIEAWNWPAFPSGQASDALDVVEDAIFSFRQPNYPLYTRAQRDYAGLLESFLTALKLYG